MTRKEQCVVALENLNSYLHEDKRLILHYMNNAVWLKRGCISGNTIYVAKNNKEMTKHLEASLKFWFYLND